MRQNIVLILVVVFLVIITGMVGHWVFWSNSKTSTQIACTQEAKQCPDGSYVERTGLNCEFALCPLAPQPKPTFTSSPWKTEISSTTNITFQYPETLTTTYIHVIDWPPQVQVLTGPFSCTQAGSEVMRAGRTEQRIINNNLYCRTIESEGAAGSVYNNYAYAFEKDGKVIVLTFTLRMVQCDNYDDPQKTACKNERSVFDVDSIVDKIAQSVVLK
ncbi:MAG: hypothetical protein M1320_01545 [Patescibacteria group bacterium]|nr:hypothetical protein [Patescibacteria group bacterium]